MYTSLKAPLSHEGEMYFTSSVAKPFYCREKNSYGNDIKTADFTFVT
jgi:hypothetical protein